MRCVTRTWPGAPTAPAALAARPLPAQALADLVLHGGRVLTVDAADRVAQAVAIQGSRIVAVGTDAEVRALVGPRTRRIDLGGRTVTPGLLDAHAHLARGGADFATDPGGTRARHSGARPRVQCRGMTGVKDSGVLPEEWDSYGRVLADSALTVRVAVLWSAEPSVAGARRLIAERGAMTKAYESTGDDRLFAAGVKLFADGAFSSRTAWLSEPYAVNGMVVDSADRGRPATDPDTLRVLVRMYHDAGIQVGVHAGSDRAIDLVVGSYAAALQANPRRGLRHAVIHAVLPSPRALDGMAALQRQYDAVYPEPSATFGWWIGEAWMPALGAPLPRRANPFRTFESRGIIWANGSDSPVTPFPARYGIWAAVTRRTALGRYGDLLGRAEAVDVRAALRAATVWAGRQMFLERKIGSVEVGKYADLAVWDRDFYTAPTDQLENARCELTVFDGQIVYRAPDGPAVEPR